VFNNSDYDVMSKSYVIFNQKPEDEYNNKWITI
jgi:hypothetical protein